ncbi:MAG: hypothetical protein ACE5KI_02700 [Dehalococcoidia bacterium]
MGKKRTKTAISRKADSQGDNNSPDGQPALFDLPPEGQRHHKRSSSKPSKPEAEKEQQLSLLEPEETIISRTTRNQQALEESAQDKEGNRPLIEVEYSPDPKADERIAGAVEILLKRRRRAKRG